MKNFSHSVCRIFYTIVLGVLFWVLPMALCAQTELINIVPTNSGSIVFSFSKLPQAVSSELSSDKKRIAITLANTSAAKKLRDELPTTDQAEHIAVQQKDKDLTVYIVLRGKYGFTQLALPYSRTLHLSIIDWEKLPQRDNLYHSGLLSLDSKLPETALDYLQQAIQKGSGNAAAVAGLISLRNGDIPQAQTNFTRALDIGTSIYDVYAAISDIATARGDTQRAQHFAQLFTQKTRLSTFPSLVPPILSNQTDVVEPRTLAQSFLNDEQPFPVGTADSAALVATDSVSRDSLVNKQVNNQAQALITGMESAERTPPSSLVPLWMQWAVYAFLFVFASGFIGVLYLYFRWRKKRLHNQTAVPPAASAFEQEMASAMQTAQAQKLTALYKQAEGEHSEEEESDSEEGRPQEDRTVEHLSLANHQRNKTTEKSGNVPNDDEPNQSDSSLLQETLYNHFPPPDHAEEVDTLARKFRKGRGELDFAVKLLARKKQDGKNKALAISADDIPDKPSHLARLAQKLGIGAGLLEMRRQLGTAIQEEKEEKLRSLFSARDRDK